MAVEEHTAQWAAAKASKIQDSFVRGNINVLSCSTTFEMGVDVGDVQAVIMRNVPPTASNYVQRAGRAGRRHDSAALVVTMAQRRSHDTAMFSDPARMINGRIYPPLIHLDNTPILRRHAHSVAFAAFQRQLVSEGSSPAWTVGPFFVEADDAACGVDRLRQWLNTKPSDVQQALQRILPSTVASSMDVAGWGWVDALFERVVDEPTFGWMTRAAEEVRSDLSALSEMVDDVFAAGEKGVDRLRAIMKGLENRLLLGFLASRNVLPKYGFPVDVVQLDLRDAGAKSRDLELDRDLRMAISEFSPSGMVVAGGELWKSEGIRRAPSGEQLPVYHWAVCGGCGAFRSGVEETEPACSVCGSEDTDDTGTFITPRYGFVGNHVGKPASRPPRGGGRRSTWFGSYRDDPPDFDVVSELSKVVTVRARASTQGQIVTINHGRAGLGYMFCDWCGRGDTVLPVGGRKRKVKDHEDLRRPGRRCNGHLTRARLGHEFLTDVLEVQFDDPLPSDCDDTTMLSVLHALLAGVPSLGIAPSDVDGTLHLSAKGLSQGLVLFDAVPGGAGFSQRIHDQLPALFSAALKVVASCRCSGTSSCYGCLRNYRNQYDHDLLSRDAAKTLLSHVLTP